MSHEKDEQGRYIVTQEEYDQAKASLREEMNYDKMSDEQKKEFDETFDKRLAVKKEGEDSDDEDADEADNEQGVEREMTYDEKVEKAKEEVRKDHNYDEMTDEQKKQFDAALDKWEPQQEREAKEKEEETDKREKGDEGRSR